MPEYKMVQVKETPYLYQERTCSMDPQDISAAMGEVFHNVMKFVHEHDATSGNQALAVYPTYDPENMTFRAGVTVSAEDAAKAKGSIKSASLPEGEVLTFTHMGPYSTLRDSYGELMQHLANIKRMVAVPTWEIYVNNPDEVPEEDLRTDIYVPLI